MNKLSMNAGSAPSTATTVFTYMPTSGACKDQVTTNLNIHFGVILHEPFIESANKALGYKEEDMAKE